MLTRIAVAAAALAAEPVFGRFLHSDAVVLKQDTEPPAEGGAAAAAAQPPPPTPPAPTNAPTVGGNDDAGGYVDADGNPQPYQGTCPEGFVQMRDIEGNEIKQEGNCTDALARGQSFMLQGVKNAEVLVPSDGAGHAMPWDPEVGCCYRIVWPQCPTGWTQAKGQYGARINDAETCFFNILNGRQFILGGTPNSYVVRLTPFEDWGTCCYKVFIGDAPQEEDRGGCWQPGEATVQDEEGNDKPKYENFQAEPNGMPTRFAVTESQCNNMISKDKKEEMSQRGGCGYARFRKDDTIEPYGGECCVYKLHPGEIGIREHENDGWCGKDGGITDAIIGQMKTAYDGGARAPFDMATLGVAADETAADAAAEPAADAAAEPAADAAAEPAAEEAASDDDSAAAE